ncbi:Hpt domain-containing protein [Pseudomonas sp. MMS21-TM103]|uniref:HD domain-containing phosphohydrolase n=1 Tax=Pseudomonas sp. MMS21 TM103 TaxID=2886506 RepID=UPI001EDD333E|nr:HD domain-containing phosphohydrolase [Pseudomonas sp. MMS21 TM103]MCG4453807.1 Hpt domain-containing protein [Pseudomonas sp. MMS21 TM103]
MTAPSPADLPNDVLADFRQETAEQFQRSEQLLIELEHCPDDRAKLNDLFRQVHTIKGNLGYIGLSALMPLPQAMEDVLACLREARLNFDNLLGDILLVTLDHLKELIAHGLGGPTARLDRTQLDALSHALRELAGAPAFRQTEARRSLLQQLDPHSQLPAPTTSCDPKAAELLEQHGIVPDEDLLFFIELMQASERRSHFWQGRGLRQLDLALAINQLGNTPEPPAQLAAAVCLHDLGMTFLPLDTLHKEARLNHDERQQMQSHPHLAYDLLKRLPQWETAADIVLQHHEHADGGGYPRGLSEREIRPGALIINIVDTFDARTHERAHQTLSKRPLLRAILEINGLAGQQFSPHWVDIFNRTLQQLPALAHP